MDVDAVIASGKQISDVLIWQLGIEGQLVARLKNFRLSVRHVATMMDGHEWWQWLTVRTIERDNEDAIEEIGTGQSKSQKLAMLSAVVSAVLNDE